MHTMASSDLYEELLWAFPRPTCSGLLGLILASLSARHRVRRTLPKQPALTLPALTQIQYNVFLLFFLTSIQCRQTSVNIDVFMVKSWSSGSILFCEPKQSVQPSLEMSRQTPIENVSSTAKPRIWSFTAATSLIYLFFFIPLSRRALQLSIFFI